jgi:hypothetical protein
MRFSVGIERGNEGRRSLVLRRGQMLMRETPSEGSEISLESQISSFWSSLEGNTFSPSQIQFVWVAERCVQLNAQAISTMPLRFRGASASSTEPSWLSNPDPVWYPNGISDAIFSAIDSFYRWGDAFLYVTSHYANGFPASWTVLDASAMVVSLGETSGRREFKIGERTLDPSRVVQVSRNPRGGLRGTSALRSYAELVNTTLIGGVAAGDALANNPPAVLKSMRKITEEQAIAIQDQWVARIDRRRRGVPPVLPPELDLVSTNLGWNPTELALVDAQEFNARTLASAFGVPPFMLNQPLTGGLTYQNPEMMGEYWWRTELYASSSRMARAFTAQMLPRGNSVFFDPAHLTQPLSAQTDEDESAVVNASPADQENISQLRPVQEVTM